MNLIYSLCDQELHIIQISDQHGWINGHRHDLTLGDFGTIASYVDRVKQNISKKNPLNASVLFIDVGDACEGTGLSDATQPICLKLYQAMSMLQVDASTVGNHDLNHDIHLTYRNYFNDGYLTTNTVMNGSDDTYGDYFKYMTTSNGLRILMFGFMYTSTNQYINKTVLDQIQVIQSPKFQQVLKDYALKTDVLVLLLHIGTRDEQANNTYQEMRRQFTKYNNTIPIFVLTAHTHMVHHFSCFDEKGVIDKQCFNTEAGYYSQDVVHQVYTFSATNYTYDNKTYNGVSLQHYDYFSPDDNKVQFIKNNTLVGLATRFNLTPDQFDTDRGKQIRKTIQQWFKELNLGNIVGCSKYNYSKKELLDSNTSLYRLYLQSIYPSLIYSPFLSSSCSQFPLIETSSFRDSFYTGNVVEDDVYSVMPFPNKIYYYEGFSANETNCVVQFMENASWEDTESSNPNMKSTAHQNTAQSLPKYVTPLTPKNATGQGCFDIITDDYNMYRVQMSFKRCLKQRTPDKIPNVTQYPVKNPNITDTYYLLKYQVDQYMPCGIDLIQESQDVSYVKWVVISCGGLVVVGAIVMLFSLL